MDDKKAKEIEIAIEKIVIYIIATAALLYFLKGILSLMNGNLDEHEEDSLVISAVILIAFIWYRFFYKKK